MAQQKPGFEDFIGTVDSDSRDFVRALHDIFTEHGCKLEIKEAKSGYVASYLLNRKTVMNYVFRRKGLLVRIYAGHIAGYMELLESLPDALAAQLRAAFEHRSLQLQVRHGLRFHPTGPAPAEVPLQRLPNPGVRGEQPDH